MSLTRREFLRGAIGCGGLLLAGSLKLAGARDTAPQRAARRFLAARQSADGAWRSERYAAFREGDVLTPVMLWSMSATNPDAGESEAFVRGRRWLEQLTDTQTTRAEPWSGLKYPLFTASYAAQVFARCGDLGRAGAWAEVLARLRTSSALGWPAGDPMCGAWSDAPAPPQYVAPVPDMFAPNISATAIAVAGLVEAGRKEQAQAALTFIEQCQNFDSRGTGSEFDDGGFFFALDDPIRNKAGVAGRDPAGRGRFRSYGSATCDGFLALRACGTAFEHPRLRAATRWLQTHADGLIHAGAWERRRESARTSLTFYHAQALASVFAQLPAAERWAEKESAALREGLLARQQADGSWQGRSPESCEDEPLLATAFALRALEGGALSPPHL